MELENRLENLQSELTKIKQKLDYSQKIKTLSDLKLRSEDPELWKNPSLAKETLTNLTSLKDEILPLELLETQILDLSELVSLNDKTLSLEISALLEIAESALSDLKKQLRFNGPYDQKNAILRITAGVGGVEAMDWASMLERMYLRFANSNHFKPTLIERISGEEAGIKTAIYEISGKNAYGNLKSEHGVHRLVRLSPFNANNLRQTSFALVEILPLIKDDNELEIPEKDLKIDTYRSGGHGGQSVNTTDSAVRITHLPTNTVVAIQNERSQIKNREKAMEILRGKLIQLKQEQQAQSLNELRAGESAKWGQQIRNYILQPYKLVKDTRTNHEDSDPDAVLDGKITDFINAYLDQIKD